MREQRSEAHMSDEPQRTRFGRASFILGLINATVFGLTVISSCMAMSYVELEKGDNTPFYVTFVVFVLLGVLPNAVGAGLGIAAQRKAGPGSELASSGTLINAILLGIWVPFFCAIGYLVGIATSEALL